MAFPEYSYDGNGVHVELNLKPYEERHRRAQQWLGDRVLEDSRSCMPLLTGSLQQRSHVEDGGKKVIFPGPYARYLYGGKVMVNALTGKGPRKIPTGPGEFVLRFPLGAKLRVTDRPLTYSNPAAVPRWFEVAKDRHGQYWIRGVRDIIAGGKNA